MNCFKFMKRLQIIFLIIFFISIAANRTNEKINSALNYDGTFLKINIDSLNNAVISRGWDHAALELYHHLFSNFSFKSDEAQKILRNFPDNFEKSFLHALIEKKNQNFKAMFDSLFSALDRHSEYLPYYDELAFSARATGQNLILENTLNSNSNLNNLQKSYALGAINLLNGHYRISLSEYLKADSLLPENKYILFNLSVVYKGLGNYKKSFETLSRIRNAFPEDKFMNAKIYLAEGTLFYLSNKINNAEILYRKAFNEAQKVSDLVISSKAAINLGICSDAKGDIEKARKYFWEGINLAEKINDAEAMALGYSELGVSYTFTYDLVNAKKYYLSAYRYYKKINNAVRLSLLSNNIGRLYINFSDYKSAAKYYETGIQFAGDDKRSQALNLIGLADVYANLSNYSKALKYYNEAQKITSELNEHSLTTEVSTGLGALNFNLGKFKNAAFYYKFAFELQNKMNDAFGLADILHKLGLTYFRMDSLASAENYFLESIKQARKSNNELAEISSIMDLADLYLYKGDASSAESFIKKAKSLAKARNWENILAELAIVEGSASEKKKNFNSAKQFYFAALNSAKHLNDYNLQIASYSSLGNLFHAFGFTEAAESFYQAGINLVETLSKPLFEETEIQISYFETKRKLYDSYAELLLEKKDYEKAFLVIDKSRSRNTMQNLLSIKLSQNSISKNENEIIYELDWMIHSGIYSEPESDSLKSILNEQLKKLIEKEPSIKKLLEPEFLASVKDFQNILKEDENFISYYSSKNNTYLFLVNKNLFKTFNLNINKNEIGSLLSKISPNFSSSRDKPNIINKDLFALNAKASNDLYKKILAPITEFASAGEKLIISPSMELLVFPFDLLVTDFNDSESYYDYTNKNFLVSKYVTSYTPSASAYAQAQKTSSNIKSSALLVGDPAIEIQNEQFSERRGLLEESVGLPRSFALLPLKYSSDEIKMIRNIIKADKVFMSKDATETNFKAYAESSSIIHLSTHSLLFKNQPLIFFSNFFDSDNDGFLEASEIAQLKLKSDLVVLSSCSSGLGMLDESEGILGMTKSFFDAGAKSIVVTLWEVNDKYTSIFMTIFYKKLSEGFDKAAALQQAKVEFIKKHSPNPYFWGAFVLSGNTDAVKFESPSSFITYLLIAVIAIMILLLYKAVSRRKKINNINNLV